MKRIKTLYEEDKRAGNAGSKAGRAVALLLVPVLALCLLWAGFSYIPAEDTFAAPADQTQQESSVVLENDQGDEVVINVEDELSAEESEEAAAGLKGAVDLGEEAVPLAGFSAVGSDRTDQLQIHLAWMVALLAAAVAYALYFSIYQNRLFQLRRKVAETEHQLTRRTHKTFAPGGKEE